MANQQNSLERSDGSGTDSRDFSYTFPTFKESEVKVEVDNVVKTLTTHYTIVNHNNSSGGTVRFNATGLPDNTASTTPIRIFRQTDVDTPKAEFTAGSALKAQEINDNFKQVRHALQEAIGATYDNSGNPTSRQVQRYNIEADAIDGTLIADDAINSEHYAAGSIDLEHMSANSVDSDQYVDGSIDRIHLEADIIDGSKIEDNAVNNEHIAADAVRTSEIQDNAVTMAKLGSGTLPTDITIASDNLVNGTIVNADVNASAAIDGTKISPDFGSQNIATTGTVDGRDVSADGTKLDTIETNAKDDQTATEIKTLYESNANTNAFTDTQNTFVNAITATATELNYVDGVTSNVQTQLDGKQPVDAELTELATMTNNTAHALADLTQAEVQTLDGITASTAELNLNKDQTATAAEVNILDGATLNTTELNKLDGFTGSVADLNEVVTGKNVVETIASNATDAQIPTAQAVNERITTVVQDVGGFVPIANETSFPVNNPDLNDAAGTIVSIKALASAFTTGSGVTTHTISNGAGSGKNVTITGLTQATTYPAGRGLILETTQYSGGGRGGDANEYEYAFHRLTLDETGVADAQAAIDDFDERYYGPFSANQATRPSGANRLNGDLYFNTSDGKMKVFNGSHGSGTWDDVAAPGNFFINTISSSSGSGGGSATFNGTATRFTLSNPPLTAQQLLVSVNGVVQKPNSGTSPSEGFAIDGADIIFAAAPNSSAPYFIVTIGSSVNIGTPSDGTVTTVKLDDGAVTNAKVSSSAAIVSTKLAKPIDFADNEKARFGTGNDLEIYHSGNESVIKDNGTGDLFIDSNSSHQIRATSNISLKVSNQGELAVQCNANGGVDLYYDNSKKFETTSYGGIFGNESSSGVASPVRLSLGGTYHSSAGGDPKLSVWSDGTDHMGFGVSGNQLDVILTSDNYDFVVYGGADGTTERFRVYGDSTGIKLPDSSKVLFGAGNDLQIYHNGTNSYITNATGGLNIAGTDVGFTNVGSSEWTLLARSNAEVELYYDGSKKLETTSQGVYIFGNLEFNDGDAIKLGNSDDFQIFHNGTASRLFNNTGQIQLESDSSIVLGKTNLSESYLKAHPDGAVQLYYDNSQKFETASYGINVQGANSYDASIKMHGQPTIGRSYWGYGGNQYYNGTLVGRTDNTIGSTIFMGVDTTGNTGSNFGGQGTEIVFRNNHIFTTPNAANTNFVTCMRFGRATSTEGAVAFTNGLMFGSDQADANILHDYEEGTWTPGVDKSSSSMSGVSYSDTSGTYTKVGRLVTVWFDITVTGGGTSGGGAPYITQLPFAALYGSGSGQQNGGYGAPQFRDATLANSNLRIYGNSSYVANSQIYLQQYNSSGNTENSTFNATGRITGQATYFTT